MFRLSGAEFGDSRRGDFGVGEVKAGACVPFGAAPLIRARGERSAAVPEVVGGRQRVAQTLQGAAQWGQVAEDDGR